MAVASLFFSSYSGLGGGETMLRALMGALDPERHAPSLICPREGGLTESVRGMGIPTHILPYRGASVWFLPWLWRRFPATRRIRDAIRQGSPSVVYSDFHSLPHVLPASRSLGIPVIYWCHALWCHPKSWQASFYRRGPDAILAPCEAVRRNFLGSPPFMPAERVQVVNPGVDTSVFRPRPGERDSIRRELGLPLDSELVTLLARFQVVKGHDVFLDAAKLLADRFPRARFVMAGENVFGGAADEALKRRILERVGSDPILRERVIFLGWISSPERLLAASDVLVCSSRFESYGMAVVEAMACGLPVVSTNVGGPSEIVVGDETGFLVPPNRPDLTAERVGSLLVDPDLRERMGALARRRAVERFELKSYAASVAEYIESLAVHPRPSVARRSG